MRTELDSCDDAPCERFDVALLDLDGVVYIGADAVPGAPQALQTARSRGMRLAFVTNNAARPPAVVAEHLRALGVPADAAEVITSSQAAAHYLAERLPRGARVLVVGTTGLVEALLERDLCPVRSADDAPVAVVQGFSPKLDWKQLAEGAVAISRGLLWVATNADRTVPSPRGPVPGNGSMVAALRHATGAEPVVTGKPDPTMHRETVERAGARRPIVVGDRLDTDIEGANAVGCASLLVLSGVTTPAALLAAAPRARPGLLGRDVGALLARHPETVASQHGLSCGEWQVSGPPGSPGPLRLSHRRAPAAAGPSHHPVPRPGGAPSTGLDDGLDALRVLCAASWQRSTRGGQPAERAGSSAAARHDDAVDDVRCVAEDSAAEAQLRELKLL